MGFPSGFSSALVPRHSAALGVSNDVRVGEDHDVADCKKHVFSFHGANDCDMSSLILDGRFIAAPQRSPNRVQITGCGFLVVCCGALGIPTFPWGRRTGREQEVVRISAQSEPSVY